MPYLIPFTGFSQRGTGKAYSEDAVLLDGQVHQGRVREHGEVDATSQPLYFAVTDGVSSGTLPRTASRRLLEVLQTRLVMASVTTSLSALLHQVRQECVALGVNAELGRAGQACGQHPAWSDLSVIVDTEFDEFQLNIVTHALQPGERLLLCSDGLNEVLSDAEIAALLVDHSDEDRLNACKASLRAGGTDDFSVIVLTF